MSILAVIAGIAALYFFLFFAAFRLFVPFMGFRAPRMPQTLPPAVKETIAQLEQSSSNAEGYFRAAYDVIFGKTLHQWHHTRFKAATRLSRLFVSDIDVMWSTRNFLYCAAINYLLYVLLAGSKYFQPSDIRVRYTFLNFVNHQYLQVKIGDRWIDADPAGSGIRGRGLGTHARFFG